MPMLMERSDRLRTVDRVRNSDRVWVDTAIAHSGVLSFRVPESGGYQVVLIKLDTAPVARKKPCVSDFLGYGRRFHPEYRSTEDVMKELREGEGE